MEQLSSSLTGVWQGLYTYPSRNQRVLFGATLIETASWVTGSTHEPCTSGEQIGETLYATLLGRRQGSIVAFTKTYDGSNPLSWKRAVCRAQGLRADLSEFKSGYRLTSALFGTQIIRQVGNECCRALTLARHS